MSRVALRVQYRGTRFAGWQRQPDRLTVQETLERALTEATGSAVAVHASGRTDAGVHAAGQVVHFDTQCPVPPEKYPEILNNLLPPDVSVTGAAGVSEDFHARRSALSKTYFYRILISPYRSATEWDTAYQIRYPLDPERMRIGAGTLVGTHDFATFHAKGSAAKTTVRTLSELRVDVVRGKVDRDGFLRRGELRVTATADGFLYNMVRVIAAQLAQVGQGRKAPEDLALLLACKDRAYAKEIVPACGLYLERVDYGVLLFAAEV